MIAKAILLTLKVVIGQIMMLRKPQSILIMLRQKVVIKLIRVMKNFVTLQELARLQLSFLELITLRSERVLPISMDFHL